MINKIAALQIVSFFSSKLFIEILFENHIFCEIDIKSHKYCSNYRVNINKKPIQNQYFRYECNDTSGGN